MQKQDTYCQWKFNTYEYFFLFYVLGNQIGNQKQISLHRRFCGIENDFQSVQFYTPCIINTNFLPFLVTTPRAPSNNGKMTYEEFVWFLMAEEDKRHPRRYFII